MRVDLAHDELGDLAAPCRRRRARARSSAAPRIPPSGFLISCARPAAIWPIDWKRSRSVSSWSRRFWSVRSRSTSTAPFGLAARVEERRRGDVDERVGVVAALDAQVALAAPRARTRARCARAAPSRGRRRAALDRRALHRLERQLEEAARRRVDLLDARERVENDDARLEGVEHVPEIARQEGAPRGVDRRPASQGKSCRGAHFLSSLAIGPRRVEPRSSRACEPVSARAPRMRTGVSVEEARAIVLDAVSPLEAERVPAADALGRVLAEPVVSAPHAPAGRLLGDGRLRGARRRPRRGRAGRAASRCRSPSRCRPAASARRALRAGRGRAHLHRRAAPGRRRHRRDAGGRRGRGRARPLPRGAAPRRPRARRPARTCAPATSCSSRARGSAPSQLGMLAALGRTQVAVHRRPRVAILSGGDELVEPDEPVDGGRIVSSNSYALAAQCREAGAEPALPRHRARHRARISSGASAPGSTPTCS